MSDYRGLLRKKERSTGTNEEAQNPRRLWKSLDRLLHPTATDPHFDAAEFATFFQEKVQFIRNSTAGSMPPAVYQPVCHRLCEFTAVTVRDIEQFFLIEDILLPHAAHTPDSQFVNAATLHMLVRALILSHLGWVA